MGKTKIPWAEHTWNPMRGCSRKSPGCINCYAEMMMARGFPAHRSPTTGEPFAIFQPSGPRWTGAVEWIPSMADKPLVRKKPTVYFVNSISDSFHENAEYQWQKDMLATAGACPHHRFIFLTKRAELMQERATQFYKEWNQMALDAETRDDWAGRLHKPGPVTPFPNVVMGVSVENSNYIPRIDALRATPAACKMVSFEPLIGPVSNVKLKGIDWAIIGGESGPYARECSLFWIMDLVQICRRDGVRVFVKQMGAKAVWRTQHPDMEGRKSIMFRDPKGEDPAEWPEEFRIRETPDIINLKGRAA